MHADTSVTRLSSRPNMMLDPHAERWENYGHMARHVAPANVHLLRLAGPNSGTLLDVGVGSGMGLTAAAELGWAMVGVDLDRQQLAEAARLGRPLVQANAMALPFHASAFDGALSNFALIFAPIPARVVAEMCRCVRAGGPVGFTGWAPDGWPGACRGILASTLGEPAVGFPTALGGEGPARQLLAASGVVDIAVESATLRWEFSNLDDAVETLTTAAGGLRMMRARAEVVGAWPRARQLLAEELATRCARSHGGVVIEDAYVAAVGRAGP